MMNTKLTLQALICPSMDLEDANSPTTRLLTLLNVSALKSKKRPAEDPCPREKLNKRKHVNSTAADSLQSEPDPSVPQNETTFQSSDDLDAEQEVGEYQSDQNGTACKLPIAQFQGS